MSQSLAISIHGHRGSRGTHPENTLPAFAEAVSAGADVLELDLQLSKEGIPVVSHDPDIGTLCDDEKGQPVTIPVPIRTLTLSQIKKFTCGARQNPKFPEQKTLPGTPLVSLEEFLVWAKTHAPKLGFNIETKMTASKSEWVADPQEFAHRVIQVLKKHHALEKTILQSFDFRTLQHAHRLEPKLQLSCLFENVADFCEATQKESAQFASPNWESVTENEIKKCHALGIKLVPWTANTEAAWKKLVALKTDAIITDYPRKLAAFLQKKIP